MAEKLVTKLSKRKCFTLNENDTLKIVSEKLQKHNIGSMPVLSTQNNNVIGIVSERDLARNISNDEFKNDLPVTEIMSKDLITCNLNTSVTELMEIITNKKIRHILIMDEILEHTAEQERVTVEIENAKQLVGKDSDKYIQNLEKKMQDHASKQEFHEGTVSSKIYENAINLLNDFIQKIDNNANAYNWLGFSYRQLGQYNKAFDPYNKALAIDKKHLGANEYLGELYLKVDKPKKAKKYLKKLSKYCKKQCEEYLELKEKIESYELNESS